MLTKKLWRRGLSLAAAVALTGSLAVGPAFAQEERYQQPTLNPRVKSIMEVDGYQFIDLNSNGELDVYEDWRQDADTRAADLVTKLAEIAREEHLAVGVRMTLSPEADIASEPRWGRVMETFGEDPDLVTQMVTAQVVAFQNGADGLNEGSIVARMKHFPGAGPQMDGKDTSPIVSSEDTLPIHLQPYYAALDVNVASIMPYYSVPLTLDMENSAIGSKATLQDLLRDQMGFEGIIQTDWGMIWAIQEALGTMTGEEVSDEEAILIGVTQSRVDGIGGESIRLIDQMEQYTNEGKIDEDILTAAATRIVKVKFQMGMFENPYCDVDYAVSFVGNEESKAVNLEAARKAMPLLKNDGILPLDANAEQTILVCGPRARDMASVNNQASDVSFDLENPLYDYGWGLSYDE